MSVSRVILASFADGEFIGRMPQFRREAESLQIFDAMHCLNAADLPARFQQEHMAYMRSQARGFGYWIWKPQVIELALAAATGDDLVVYLDAGFTLNPYGRERFLEYLDIARDSPFKMLSFQSVHTENRWTKTDLTRRLGLENSPRVMNTSQLGGGFIVLGKTSSNLDLIREWQQLAVEDHYRYSDDSPSQAPDHPSFREHRHDQSIASLLRKRRGTTITHYEVQGFKSYFINHRERLPAWATRLKE